MILVCFTLRPGSPASPDEGSKRSLFWVLTNGPQASRLTLFTSLAQRLPMRGVAVCAFLFLLAHACVLRAQSTNASITGRITDPSHALITDAKVAVISLGTNAHYETTTNDSGEYYLANLPPDSYRIEIEKPGFKKLIKPNVILHVQDALRLDFEMTLGDVSETITVEAGAPLL